MHAVRGNVGRYPIRDHTTMSCSDIPERAGGVGGGGIFPGLQTRLEEQGGGRLKISSWFRKTRELREFAKLGLESLIL